MSGYSVQERSIGKNEKRKAEPVCGGCGGPVERGELICGECIVEGDCQEQERQRVTR